MAGNMRDSASDSSDDIPAIEVKRSTSISASQKPQRLPWDKSHLHDELSDDVHLDLERRDNKRTNRVAKDGYGKTARTTSKYTRNRQASTSGNSSKMTSPESNVPAENPFTFQSSVSTGAIPFTPTPSGAPVGKTGPPLTQTNHRNRKTKKRKKDRSYDRDLKLLGAESYDKGIHAVAMQDLGYSKPAYEVETSSRFLSLASRPVEKFEKEEPKSDVERSFTFRRQSLSRSASKWPNCPRERVKFYEYFSVLIELGSKAKRKREEQLRKNGSEPGPEAWRNELNDVLWLELQAWMHNQDMHNYDVFLMNEREKINVVLSQIWRFKIEDPDIAAPCSLVCSIQDEIDGSYVRCLQLAYREVGKVLRQLEEVEHLYPSTKKIGLSHAMYDRIQFQDKVKALIMWTNFYNQLSFRLQAVSGIICGRKHNDVFPVLPVSLSSPFLGELDMEATGDVVDGIGGLEIDSGRSGFSSRASSFHDLEALAIRDNGGGDQALQGAIRNFLEKSMRMRGLEKTIQQIKGLIFPTLRHILKNLIQPVSGSLLNRQTSAPEPGTSEKSVDIVKLWCDLHRDSNLPCLDRVFAYMLRLPMQILKEGIVLRLEQKPEAESDIATLNQLIHECKDTLILAINIRNDYIELGSCLQHHNVLASNLKGLDDLMKKLLMLYLEYLHLWIVTLQKDPKASRLQKTILEDEWKTMTVLCGGIDDAEVEMPKVFCAIVQGLLTGIGGLLDSGLDDFITSLYRSEEGANGLSPSKDMFRQFFRDCKAVFLEARERCFKLLEFTKLLHKDLEIAATFDVTCKWSDFLDLLANSGHHEVVFCADSGPSLVDRKFRFFVPSTVTASAARRLLNATMGTRETDGDIDGYLVIGPNCPDGWHGKTVKLDADATGAIRHSHLELDIGHIMIVVLKSVALSAQTKAFEKKLPRDSVKSAIPQTTCHQGISQDLENIKEESLELGRKICTVILRVQDEIGVEQFPEIAESERSLLVKTSRELLHQTYNFCMEYHRELARLNFSEEEMLARQLTFLARQWMDFVIQKCERGTGTRPRWSTPGLDYLTLAVKPNYTRYLSDEDFLSLKNQIDTCVTHVIGDTPAPGVKSPTESPNSSTFYLSPPQSSLSLHRHSLSFTDSALLSVPSRMSSKSDTVSCESSEEDDSESYDPHHRIEEATEKLDSRLNQKLIEKKAVGRVVATESTKTLNHLKARKVPFKWRLCGKLGSGRHADVYKVINLETSSLMAVKKFEVTQTNYAERVTKLATEIEWLAGLKHQNVVQYFGVEIHRDELMLFMEYCDGGTLSEVARQGLDMIMVRVYTKQLLLGISYLHENGICHLDIKGQNVFLTSAGQVKLGDFSEMVKLEDPNNTATNEITPNTGTPRYMSPEMIRGDTAIGRATDIWSLGCVVVEMITGKTPKFDKEENDFAIMFHVGGGGRPKIPEHLSADANDFLDHCFQNKAESRWKAEKLLNHPFVTVDISSIPS